MKGEFVPTVDTTTSLDLIPSQPEDRDQPRLIAGQWNIPEGGVDVRFVTSETMLWRLPSLPLCDICSPLIDTEKPLLQHCRGSLDWLMDLLPLLLGQKARRSAAVSYHFFQRLATYCIESPG